MFSGKQLGAAFGPAAYGSMMGGVGSLFLIGAFKGVPGFLPQYIICPAIASVGLLHFAVGALMFKWAYDELTKDHSNSVQNDLPSPKSP